jgi:hypothetical protein
MPYYKFVNKETGEEIEELMSHAKLEQYVEDNPHLQRVFEFPAINTTNSATFLDGHAPSSRKEAIALEKRIAKLKVKAAGTKHTERGEIHKEIKTLEGTRKAPIGSNKGHKEQ